MYKFKFADIGEGLHEGTVGEILVKVGSTVVEGDSLFVVETDKVTSDIPCPVHGTIKEIHIKTGETVHVGDVTFTIDDGSGEAAAEEAPAVEEKEEESAASVVGDIKVSNNLFSANMFGKSAPAPKATVAKSAVVEAPKSSSSKFDLNSVSPKGNGTQVDVVVIGTGPGGYVITGELAKLGYNVVAIEEEKAGGVCLNVGCIPTKTLLKTAKTYSHFKHADVLGIDVDVSKIKLNWKKMQERKTTVSGKLEKGVEYIIKAAKAKFVKGRAEIVDKHNVKVGKEVYTTKAIVIATGSSPIMLPLDGFDKGVKDGVIIDSTGALSLKEIPKKFAVIGGGVIGVEFATLFNELGSEVTILEGGPAILGPMDGEVKKLAEKMITGNGIKIEKNVKVKSFENGKVVYETADGKEVKLLVDNLLVSVGRRTNSMNLDETIGLKLGQRKEILVNESMQTSIDNIFAIGDVTGMSMLAHTAYKHAFVLKDFLNKKAIYKSTFDPFKVPAAVYTYPEISSIGKTEEQLKEDGTEYISSVWQNTSIGKALADDSTIGFTKLLVGKKYGQVLGAHIVNDTSSDTIAEIAVLMETEGTVYELANTIHPHPSLSEGVYEAALHAVEKLQK